jgi:hypothetical protein
VEFWVSFDTFGYIEIDPCNSKFFRQGKDLMLLEMGIPSVVVLKLYQTFVTIFNAKPAKDFHPSGLGI